MKKHRLFNTPLELNHDEITVEVLEKCLVISAKIVSLYGKKYLPIFLRFQKEIVKTKDQNKVLDLIDRIANDNQE